jgi:SAM-dependent methyltransferase
MTDNVPGGPAEPARARGLGPILVSARPLDEYLAMFDLTAGDLCRGLVLDCPSGVGSTAAEMAVLGGRVVGVDPAYALPPQALFDLGRTEVGRGNAYVATHAGRYVWGFMGSVEDHRRRRTQALERFAADYVSRPQGYVAARLPHLPFADAAFALVLSAHLLFSYPDHFDRAAHVANLLELVRVSAGEVRVFPLVDSEGVVHPEVDAIRADVAARGVASELRRVPYEFQRGGHTMLVCRKEL